MSLMIGNKRIDDPQNTFVIAEAAGCHQGDYNKAAELVIAAALAGADAVKFQLLHAEGIAADIPIPTGFNEQHDAWLKALGVTRMRQLFALGGLQTAWCKPLKRLAEEQGIAWLCTPFSVEEARFLVEEVGVQGLKIASGDLTFTPLLAYAASTDLPVILSTGGATIGEIETALSLFAHDMLCYNVILMHCRSIYPCPDELANLASIPYLLEYDHFGVAGVGWSDHTLSPDLVPALAVSQGAVCLEKHLRLEGDTESIDAAHSLSPSQFRQMVDTIRRVPAIIGQRGKEPHAREAHDRLFARRDPSDWLRPLMRGRRGDWE